MKIEVRLFATLREKRQKVMTLEVPQGTAAVELIDSLDIPHNQVAILMINGRHSKFHQPLQDGDVVSMFPPVGGG
ncbi:MoaD/ThiS family protein [Sinanaerobacter chloroacetimidivorans]|uniref:MoaD/ThiS family protein n=1 Tax=Sinanaerobacter chloroacetimidivorans TaxID=2818044 RepID=A0A8J7W2T4_9FIRM|nr:MoaD/ThiS family protein [Sinanaerobacter chloroacetimidivorans]MBR0598230.1 MoaD/ThiS family protein [Sinanaerobacter chloroacetimidivorans]